MPRALSAVACALIAIALARAGSEAPLVTGGSLDLSHWSFEQRGPVDLAGEWEVCWGELVDPASPECARGGWRRFPVPRLWSDDASSTPIGGKGVATYRATIALPAGEGPLALIAGSPITAYRLFISGRDVGGSGTVGTSRETTVASLDNQLFPIDPGATRLELLVHIANFEFRGGGMRRLWQLGLARQVEDASSWALLRYGGFAVASIVVGLLFLAQYGLRRSERARGWFGLFAVLVGLRIVPGSTSNLYPLLMGWASFDTQIRLEYINTALLIFVGGGYLRAKVPGVMPERLTQIVRLAGLALVPIQLLGSLDTVLATLGVILVLPPLAMIVTTASYGRAWLRGTPDTGATLAAAIVFTVSVAHDVFRTSTGLGASIELFPYFVVVWLASEAYSLLRSFARTFERAETLSRELEDANFELQETEQAVVRFVPFALLRTLGKQSIRDVRAGDHVETELAVIACRLRVDASVEAEETFAATSALVGDVARAIQARGGFVGQSLGDELLAVMAGERIGDVLGVAAELRALASGRRATLCMGIAVGPALVGAGGSEEGLSSLVVGESVTLARAALACAAASGAEIAMTGSALSKLPGNPKIETREIGMEQTRDGAVTICEVIAPA